MNQTTQMIVAAGRIRRVVDELREHGPGRSCWMKDQLKAVRGIVADASTIHWSADMLHAAGDAVQDVFEGTTYLHRPFVAIEHLERAEKNIERLAGNIAMSPDASFCCGAELRSVSDGSIGREPGVPATCSRCGEPA